MPEGFPPPPRRLDAGTVRPCGPATRCATALLLGWLHLAGCEQSGTEAARPGVLPDAAALPNVVLIMIDTLRADGLGCYGSRADISPTIDSIAAEGVLFERALAQAPWTQPSVASLFCGYYPGVHRVTSYRTALKGAFLDEARAEVFDGAFQTLPELLQEAGYQTAAISANPLVCAEFGFGQGFGSFRSYPGDTTGGGELNVAVADWLGQRNRRKPFFLYVHYMDVHGPYDAPADILDPLLTAVEQDPHKHRLEPDEVAALAYLNQPPRSPHDPPRHAALAPYREYWVARYESGVTLMDRVIDELRAILQDAGVWNDAYVIITADHGEALCEHGGWNHGLTVHDYEAHVPLILRWKNVLPAGKRIAATVRLIDVLPTLAEQLRGPALPDIQGLSLVGHFADAGLDAAVPALIQSVSRGPPQRGLYLDHWKLYEQTDPAAGLVRRRLYDLSADPLELNDVAAQNADKVAELARISTEILEENQRLRRRFDAQTIEMSQEHERQLRALGYLGSSGNRPPFEPATRPATRGP